MDLKGSGISYVSEYHSDEMKVFRGGLRHLPQYADYQVHGTKQNLSNFHDKMTYDRGFIQHSRTPSNQYVNFQFMFGGPKNFIFQRIVKQAWYRKNVRNWWFPVVFSYSLGCFCMRLYDNAAHDYFYFTD